MKLHLQELVQLMLQIIIIGGASAMLVILSMVAALWWSLSQPKGRLNCNSFGSYSAAVTAFKDGAHYLDRGGDGVPCESLLKKPKDI